MENVLIFGHKNPDTDAITSSIAMANLEKKLGNEGAKAYRLGRLNKETEYVLDYFKVEVPELLEEVSENDNVILVDHNNFSQSVNGIEKANIIKVVDHHAISNFETNSPIYYLAEPVGCTETLIYELYKKNNIEITSVMAGLMLSAIISDTLLFKSPTCTDKDKKIAEELANIANIDINTYGMDMLKAGTDLSDFSAEEIIELDSKSEEKNGIKIQVSQVNTACIDDVLKMKKELEKAMSEFINKNHVNLFLFAITDIVNSDTMAIVLGDRTDIVEKGFGVKIEDNKVLLKGVVSRKKQIFPVIKENA